MLDSDERKEEDNERECTGESFWCDRAWPCPKWHPQPSQSYTLPHKLLGNIRGCTAASNGLLGDVWTPNMTSWTPYKGHETIGPHYVHHLKQGLCVTYHSQLANVSLDYGTTLLKKRLMVCQAGLLTGFRAFLGTFRARRLDQPSKPARPGVFNSAW